tara:strand:+ start:150 stop:494 length:345 start_codon:yes stop_codon:yes gene_type:complete
MGDNTEILNHIKTTYCLDEKGFTYILKPIIERLKIGKERYGHEVIVDSDASKWTVNKKNNWLAMAEEEFYDGIVYLTAARIREHRNLSNTNETLIKKIDIATAKLIEAVLGLYE